MRLLDQIARGQVSGDGAATGRLVHDTALRYIVDGAASRQCFDLVRADAGLLDPANPLLRVPAEMFWLEWLSEAPPGQTANHRLGVLVDAAEDGRSGAIHPFWQQDERQAAMARVRILFDLDRPLVPPPGAASLHRLRHAGMPHLDALFGHMLAEVDRGWAGRRRLADPRGAEAALRTEAEAVWFNLPFVLAFAVLLGSRDAVEQRPADLARLNRARLRRGREPLLDHIEVGLRLGGAAAAGERADGAGSGARGAPRLHFVRGHSVRRGDTVFWRTPHLRGDAHRRIRSRTVTVKG